MNNFTFRFKQTKKAEFPKNIALSPQILKLEQMRQQINNFNQLECIKGNLQYCEKLECLQSEFIVDLNHLIINRDNTQVQFSWNDSFEPNNFEQFNGFHYEFICQLYNLGMLYYHISINSKLIREQVDNSRYSLWCFQKLKDSLVFVSFKNLEKISDLSILHIQMIIFYIQALTYKKLYETFFLKSETNEEKNDCFGILNEALKNYEQACRCLLQTKISNKKEIPPIIFNQLQQIFDFQKTQTEVCLYVDLAKFLEYNINQGISENPMGLALLYLKKADLSIQSYYQKYPEDILEENLKKDRLNIEILKRDFEQKNQTKYHQPLAKEYELLALKQKSEFLKSKPFPKYSQSLIINQSLTQSPQLSDRLLEIVKQKKDKAYQYLHLLQGEIEWMYKEYQLQFMMDAYVNADQMGLTPVIQKAVQYIKEQGGWKGLSKRQDKILQFEIESLSKLNYLKELLEKKSQIQVPAEGAWLLNKNINQFKTMIDLILVQINEAKNINQKIFQPIEQVKDQIHFVEQNNNTIIANRVQQSLNESQKFYKDNIFKLKKIALSLENIQNKINIIKQILEKMNSFIDSLKLQEASNIDEQQFQQNCQQIDNFLREIKEIIEKINLTELEDHAKVLFKSMKIIQIANQTEEEFERKLNVIVEAFSNLKYAEEFYDSIYQQIDGIAEQLESLGIEN